MKAEAAPLGFAVLHLLSLGMSGLVVACATAPQRLGYAPVEAPIPRHWDQVCQSTESRGAAISVAELLDTVGLGRVLDSLGPKPRPLTPPWPFFDYIIRYDGTGRVVAKGRWEATVDTALVAPLDALLGARTKSLPDLLGPTGFRARVLFARRTSVALGGPVECMPHMVHRPGQRPTGLPSDVRVWGGAGGIQRGDTSVAVVKIYIGADGKVEDVEAVRGAPSAVERVRGVVGRLRFDPALDNGVPVPGHLVETFRFVTRTRGPSPTPS